MTEPINLYEFVKMDRDNNWEIERSYINGCFNGALEGKIILSGKRVDYNFTEFANFDNYIFNSKNEKVDVFNIR